MERVRKRKRKRKRERERERERGRGRDTCRVGRKGHIQKVMVAHTLTSSCARLSRSKPVSSWKVTSPCCPSDTARSLKEKGRETKLTPPHSHTLTHSHKHTHRNSSCLFCCRLTEASQERDLVFLFTDRFLRRVMRSGNDTHSD